MPYLQNEKARTQAEIKSIDAAVANLNGQAQTQQQAITQAQTQANDARTRLTGFQVQRPGLQTNATAADQRVADLNAQIEEHQGNEPDKLIERPNKPPLLNPKWSDWKKRLDQLTESRDEAVGDASAAHDRLNDLDHAISQAAADVQAAENRATQAAATLAQLNQAISAARQQVVVAHQKLDELTRWSDEIDRHLMDRKALERVAAGLSARVIELEDSHRAASAASTVAEAALASLISRRDQLTIALTAVNNQIPSVDAEAKAADIALEDLAAQVQTLLEGP